MSTAVYLDTNDDDARSVAALGLHAVRLGQRWNGFETPLVFAGEFERWISAWSRNDPNGTWNPDGVAEGDGALVYEDESGREVWSVVDVVDGRPVYALDGWQWTAA